MTEYIDRTGEPDEAFEREVLARVGDPMTPVPSSPVALLDQLDELLRVGTERPWIRWHDQEHIPGWDGFCVIGDDADEGEECNPTARVYTDYDAALIVAAVNAVGPLTAAVRAVLELADELAQVEGSPIDFGPRTIADRLRAALSVTP